MSKEMQMNRAEALVEAIHDFQKELRRACFHAQSMEMVIGLDNATFDEVGYVLRSSHAQLELCFVLPNRDGQEQFEILGVTFIRL